MSSGSCASNQEATAAEMDVGEGSDTDPNDAIENHYNTRDFGKWCCFEVQHLITATVGTQTEIEYCFGSTRMFKTSDASVQVDDEPSADQLWKNVVHDHTYAAKAVPLKRKSCVS